MYLARDSGVCVCVRVLCVQNEQAASVLPLLNTMYNDLLHRYISIFPIVACAWRLDVPFTTAPSAMRYAAVHVTTPSRTQPMQK